MDPQSFLSWSAALLFLSAPPPLHSVSVRIVNEEPVHVVPGSSLVLKAQIEHGAPEEAASVSWEREAETGTPPGRVTLATCPGGGPACAGSTPNVRASRRQRETTLEMNGFSGADSGVYTVTVTDHTGVQTAARCIVREYEAVHHVSLGINVSRSSLVCGEAWGTEPAFSWLYERAAITPSVGQITSNGTTLVLSMTPVCGHFTCVVSNKLGYSSATYAAGPCEAEARGTTAAVVGLVILLLGGGALVFLLWRRNRLNDRGERLHEDLDDNV